MGLLGKLFKRRPVAAPPPEPEPMFVRPDRDDDWAIAAARHRFKTEPVVRNAQIMRAQPQTVIPVPTLPVASDPSQVRLRQDTRPTPLMPRHMRFARGTERPDTQDDTTGVHTLRATPARR